MMDMQMFKMLQEAMQKHGPSLVSPTAVDYDEEAAKSINESYDRLSELLGSQEKIDYRAMAQPFFDRINQRQMPQMPGRAEAFASAFGSPEGSQATMQKIATAQASSANKEKDLLDMEGRILEAQINEAMQKGQNSRALALNRERQRLEHHLGRLKAREEQGFKVELEGVKNEQRQKNNQAMLERVKARAGSSGLSFDERVALKIIDASVRAQLARNLLTGKRDLDEEDRNAIIEETLGTLKDLQVPHPSGTKAAPGATQAPAGKKSRARIIAEKLQKQQNSGGE